MIKHTFAVGCPTREALDATVEILCRHGANDSFNIADYAWELHGSEAAIGVRYDGINIKRQKFEWYRQRRYIVYEYSNDLETQLIRDGMID